VVLGDQIPNWVSLLICSVRSEIFIAHVNKSFFFEFLFRATYSRAAPKGARGNRNPLGSINTPVLRTCRGFGGVAGLADTFNPCNLR